MRYEIEGRRAEDLYYLAVIWKENEAFTKDTMVVC